MTLFLSLLDSFPESHSRILTYYLTDSRQNLAAIRFLFTLTVRNEATSLFIHFFIQISGYSALLVANDRMTSAKLFLGPASFATFFLHDLIDRGIKRERGKYCICSFIRLACSRFKTRFAFDTQNMNFKFASLPKSSARGGNTDLLTVSFFWQMSIENWEMTLATNVAWRQRSSQDMSS